MHDAIRTGSVWEVMYALSLKAQTNCVDPTTLESPLHLALSLRHANIFGFLLLVSEYFSLADLVTFGVIICQC